MFETAHFYALAGMLLLVASLFAAGHALLNKRDPRSALGWIALILFAPVVGIILYLLLGVNRVQRRARRNRRKREIEPVNQRVPSDTSSLRRTMQAGNYVECLLTSDHIFDTMRHAIQAAHRRICLSVYIFESHGIGQKLIDDLAAAAQRGVEVKVLLDGAGALYSLGSTRRKLTKAGVEVGMFLPVLAFPPNWHINLRNHRKILLVDDLLAIVGGTNVRNGYFPSKTKPGATIRDMNFKLRGPVVEDISSVFSNDWLSTTNKLLPPIAEAEFSSQIPENAQCRVIIDGPDNDVDLLSLVYQSAIDKAKTRVRILTPYFLPPSEVIAALQLAAIRGVRVEVVLPGVTNIPVVHWATKNFLWQLLRYGVRVRYQAGVFDHSKLLLVDDSYCLIGSANLDARSLRLNFEIGVEIESSAVVQQLNDHVDQCTRNATDITQKQLDDRSLPIRMRDALAWLFTPYL